VWRQGNRVKRNILKNKLFSILALVAGLCFTAQAIETFSRNVVGNLETAAVWTLGAPTSSDVAVWSVTGNGARTNSLGADVSWLGIRVDTAISRDIVINTTGTGALTLGSSGIDMSAVPTSTANNLFTIKPNVILGAAQTWNVAENATLDRKLQVDGIISGSSGNNLIKSGTGTLELNGDNTYSGTTTINGGTVQVGNGGATGSLGAGDVINNGALVYNRTGTFTNSSVISGSGSLALTAGTLVLSGDNTFSGGFTATLGSVKLADVNGFGTGTVTFNGGAFSSSADLQTGNGGQGILNNIVISKTTAMNMLQSKTLFSGQWSGTNAINVNGFSTGNLILTGDNSTFSGPVNMVSPTALVAGHNNALGTGKVSFNTGLKSDAVFRTTKDLAIANNMNVGASGTNSLTISVTNNLILSGVLSGDASLVKAGSGVLTLTSVNTYTNTTTVSDGTLVGNENGCFGTGDMKVGLAGTNTIATLTLNGAYMNDLAMLVLETNSVLNLDFTGNDIVGGVIIDGVNIGAGTFTSTQLEDLGLGTVTGTGRLMVGPESVPNLLLLF
jgi:autotransporter-associated beta strand protein